MKPILIARSGIGVFCRCITQSVEGAEFMPSFRNPNASTEQQKIQMNLEEIDRFVLDLVQSMDKTEIQELSESLKNLCDIEERHSH